MSPLEGWRVCAERLKYLETTIYRQWQNSFLCFPFHPGYQPTDWCHPYQDEPFLFSLPVYKSIMQAHPPRKLCPTNLLGISHPFKLIPQLTVTEHLPHVQVSTMSMSPQATLWFIYSHSYSWLGTSVFENTISQEFFLFIFLCLMIKTH